MATSKASTSGLTGSKSKDASAGTTKIPALPDTPTIGSASTVSGAASISFTAANRGGATTNFQAISSPGSVTKNSTTSPINYDALDLTVGTSYTFTVKGVNSSGNSALSAATNSFTQPGYTLSQTFNTSGVYTTPAGITQLAVKLVGAGAGGGGGAWGSFGYNINAGGGGGGAGAGIIEDIATSQGTTYTVTVPAGGAGGVGHDGNNGYQGDDGSASGQTRFGNVVIANGSNGGARGYQGNDSNSVAGSGGNFSYNSGTLRSSTNGKAGGNTQSAGANTAALTTPNAQVGTYSVSGGGGGGGAGDSGGAGGAGGTFNGGAGGKAVRQSPNVQGPGGGGNGNLGGGGGGGGNGFWGGNENYLNAPGGGAGGAGQVIVFVK